MQEPEKNTRTLTFMFFIVFFLFFFQDLDGLCSYVDDIWVQSLSTPEISDYEISISPNVPPTNLVLIYMSRCATGTPDSLHRNSTEIQTALIIRRYRTTSIPIMCINTSLWAGIVNVYSAFIASKSFHLFIHYFILVKRAVALKSPPYIIYRCSYSKKRMEQRVKPHPY